MDPFEEFEFKPLTEGLGFHKKKAATPEKASKNDDLDSSYEMTRPSSKMKNSFGASREDLGPDPLRSPLPRKNSAPTPMSDSEPGSTSSAVDEILKTLQQNRRLDFENKEATKVSNLAPTKDEFKTDTWNPASAFLDGMLVMAATLLCMIVVLMVTKADLMANLSNPGDGMIYYATFALLASVSLIYLLVNRMFIGATPGEWAFEQRIGKPEQMTESMYPVRILGRSLLVIATGFVLLPILSALMNKDLAGEATGAILYRKV